jgi:putative aldouronate transport system substrate-binding protein
MKTAEKNDGVTCAAYDLTTDHLVACEEHNNGDIAIAAASSDPLRTAMVIDILKMDTYVNRLVNLGIEGEHYNLGEKYEKGWYYTKTDNSANYAPDGNSLSWAVRDGVYEEEGQPEREKEMYDAWDERIVSNPTVTFVFDDAAVADSAAACKQILGDYVPSLQLGLVDDIDASLAEMNSKLETAGIQQVEEEMMRQYSEWLATQ